VAELADAQDLGTKTQRNANFAESTNYVCLVRDSLFFECALVSYFLLSFAGISQSMVKVNRVFSRLDSQRRFREV